MLDSTEFQPIQMFLDSDSVISCISYPLSFVSVAGFIKMHICVLIQVIYKNVEQDQTEDQTPQAITGSLSIYLLQPIKQYSLSMINRST